jgi:hypothetical protein
MDSKPVTKNTKAIRRCLGHGREHTFISKHRFNRVCDACERQIKQMAKFYSVAPDK